MGFISGMIWLKAGKQKRMENQTLFLKLIFSVYKLTNGEGNEARIGVSELCLRKQ